MKNKTPVIIQDKARTFLRDYIVENGESFRKKGIVLCFNKTTGELEEYSNLIVYNGREIGLQKMTGVNRTATDVQNLTISWISLGIKGCQPDNVFAPISPDPNDTALYEEIVIDDTNPLYADSGKKIPYTLTYLPDDKNNNKMLIGEFQFQLNSEEGNGTGINDISEAALWLADSKDPSLVTTFELWARVTFNSKRKNIENEYLFYWYLLF